MYLVILRKLAEILHYAYTSRVSIFIDNLFWLWDTLNRSTDTANTCWRGVAAS